VANADGSGERNLLTRSLNGWLSDAGPAWSPDGKTIACGEGSDSPEPHMTVIGLEPDTGNVKPLTSQNWAEVHRVIWMSDGTGFTVLAKTEFQGSTQIWFISHPDGLARRVTNDLNSYGRVSLGLAADNSSIVTVQSDPSTQIWTLGFNEAGGQAKQITNGKVDGVDGLTWGRNGRIVYVAQVGEKSELWIMNADGSDNKQLTSDGYPKDAPTISPDGKFIFFASLQSRVPHIWRINSDGSSPKQITSGDFADFDPTCAPNGEWIAFKSLRTGTPLIWKIGVDGGEAVQLTNKHSSRAFFSPDGTSLACGYFIENTTSSWKIAIIPIAGGEPSRLIDAPEGRHMGNVDWAWSPDGRAIIYAGFKNAVSNLWSQPLDGGKPSQITNFTTETIQGLAVAPDGKHIALSRGHSTLDVVLIKDSK
jgi:Tol biopolymer transport system component